jgi:predicted secreted protein
LPTRNRSLTPNENKISDGWRERAWLRIESGIS